MRTVFNAKCTLSMEQWFCDNYISGCMYVVRCVYVKTHGEFESLMA